MKLQPLGTRVLILREPEIKMSKGGIIIPDTYTDKPNSGIVSAVGEGRTLDDGTVIPCTLKVGDTVMFARFAGMEVLNDKENGSYLIMQESEIIGRVIDDGN